MWKFVVAVPLFIHALAHLSGYLASWTSMDAGFSERPWIFSQTVHLNYGIGRLFGLLWLAAMAGLSGSAFGIMFRKDWWTKLAVVSAIVSIGVIVPWWQTVPTGAKVGAFFDLLVLFLMLSPLKEKTVDFLG